MPVVTAIIPKLYENSCDCLLIIYFKSWYTMLCKTSHTSTSHTSNGRAEQLLLLAHDSEMAPRFRLADEETTLLHGGSVQVMNTSSHAQH